MSLTRMLRRLAFLGAAGTIAKKVLDSRRAAPAGPSPSPAPPAAVQPEPRTAPAPDEAPGPSVNAGGAIGSETERAEAAEATVPDPPAGDDALVAEQEAAAGAEAGAIGGRKLDDAHGDPELEAAYEAGGGEAEGFEAAEEQLVDNASHGGGRGNPTRDAMTPEVESDEQTSVDGEADEVIEADDRN
jgi:hypothetical protein